MRLFGDVWFFWGSTMSSIDGVPLRLYGFAVGRVAVGFLLRGG